MKKADKGQLMNQLAERGYALVQPMPTGAGENLLMNLLRQDDPRLLEGFPVVLADLMKEREALDWEGKKWRPSGLSKKVMRRFLVMLAVSYSLFRLFGMRESEEWVMKILARWGETKEAERLTNPFLESVKLDGGVELSTERLKNTFRNYVVQREGSAEVQKKKHALELELLLSELFTARQKELLKKRLEGKRMTKTEKEYFYRVVGKRLKVLANEELHQMARGLVLKR